MIDPDFLISFSRKTGFVFAIEIDLNAKGAKGAKDAKEMPREIKTFASLFHAKLLREKLFFPYRQSKT
jgi:hypothetical protein